MGSVVNKAPIACGHNKLEAHIRLAIASIIWERNRVLRKREINHISNQRRAHGRVISTVLEERHRNKRLSEGSKDF